VGCVWRRILENFTSSVAAVCSLDFGREGVGCLETRERGGIEFLEVVGAVLGRAVVALIWYIGGTSNDMLFQQQAHELHFKVCLCINYVSHFIYIDVNGKCPRKLRSTA
jgi:hypothetical protein